MVGEGVCDDLEGDGHSLFKHICLERLRKTINSFSQDSQ
jgi:hypothetical protein